jgi:hypothetical protein
VSTLTEQPIGHDRDLDAVHRELRRRQHSAAGGRILSVDALVASFGDLLRDPIVTSSLWSCLRRRTVVIFMSAAWARFADKDVTS